MLLPSLFTAQRQLQSDPQARPVDSAPSGSHPAALQESPLAPLATAGQQHAGHAEQRQLAVHRRGAVSFAERDDDHAQLAPAEQPLQVASSIGSDATASSVEQPSVGLLPLPRGAGPAALQQSTGVEAAATEISDEVNEDGSSGQNAAAVGTGSTAVQPSRDSSKHGLPGQGAFTALPESPAQQAQHAQQAQQAEFESQGPPPLDPPQSLTPSVKPQRQPNRGQSGYAAKDYSPLEKYKAALVSAYAASFVAGAMMQHALPAAANTVVSERHTAALVEVRRKNAETKQLHLEEVKVERAAWQKHEEDIRQ